MHGRSIGETRFGIRYPEIPKRTRLKIAFLAQVVVTPILSLKMWRVKGKKCRRLKRFIKKSLWNKIFASSKKLTIFRADDDLSYIID